MSVVYFEDTGAAKLTQRLNVFQTRGDYPLGIISWNSRTKSYAFKCDRGAILVPQVMQEILAKLESMGVEDPNRAGL